MRSSADDVLDRELGGNSRAADALRGLVIAGIVYSAEGRLSSLADLLRLARRERGRIVWTRGARRRPSRDATGAARAFLGALTAIKPRSTQEGLAGLEALRRGMARAAALDPESAWAQLGLGLSLHLRRDFLEAAARYARAGELRPKWAWPVLLRGDALQFGGRMEDGLAEFDRASRLPGGGAWAGLLASRAERWRPEGRARRIADLDRAARGLPDWGPLLAWRAQAHRMTGGAAAARRDFARAAALDPRYDRTFAWRGDWLVDLGRWAEALPDLDRACRLNPYYDIPLFARAHARLKLGRGREALADLTRALDMQVRVDLEEDSHHFRSGRLAWKRALGDLAELERLFPRSAAAARHRGRLLLQAGDLAGAVERLDRAVALGAKDDWTFAWRGQARRRLGLLPEARADLDRAVAARRGAWALAWRSQVRSELGDEKGAFADASAAPRVNPLVFAGHAAHAAALVRRRDWAGAAAALARAYEIYPQEGWIGAWIGRLLCRLGKWKDALPWVRLARNYRYDAWIADLERRAAGNEDGAWDEAALAWEDAAGAAAAYESWDDAALRVELEYDPLDANAEAARALRAARGGDLAGAASLARRVESLAPAHPALDGLRRALAAR